MSEKVSNDPESPEDRPTSRKIGEQVMKVTYVPNVDPETVREADGIGKEYPGKAPILQAFAWAANSGIRLDQYRSKRRR